MTPKALFRRIDQFRLDNPDHLMARHISADYYHGLSTELRRRLDQIIRSGIANPDSALGAYAMGPTDYDDFADLFDPMVRDFHGIAGGAQIAQDHDWDTTKSLCDLGEIDPALRDVSMRVRVARNALDFPLPGAMTKSQRIDFENQAVTAFTGLAENPDFGGRYLSISTGSPHEISAAEYQKRVDSHQMFKDMRGDRFLDAAGISNHWPQGRGMYISKAEDFIVWVGEEDHLRIMAMQTGGNLNVLFERLRVGLNILEELLPKFAMSGKYGAIASCPSNIGAGMRASLHIKLPKLTRNGEDLAVVTDHAKSLGLAIRGVRGEHTGAGSDGLVDISPSVRLGVSEMQIMVRLYDGAAALWKLEQAA